MKKIIPLLKNQPALKYLVIFLLMIVPSLLLFTAAESESQIGLSIFLGIVILANLFAALG